MGKGSGGACISGDKRLLGEQSRGQRGTFFFLSPCHLQPQWAPETCHPGPTTVLALIMVL